MQKPDKSANLSPAFLKHIGDYMMVRTLLAKADACIVFGNNQHSTHLAEQAAHLYKQAFAA